MVSMFEYNATNKIINMRNAKQGDRGWLAFRQCNRNRQPFHAFPESPPKASSLQNLSEIRLSKSKLSESSLKEGFPKALPKQAL